MSQFNAPPPPPGSVPPNYGQPPQGFPPPGYGQMPPSKTSIAAIISLISGILGCLIVPAIIAVITGIIGIKATSNPNVKGRGLAITGLILGLVFGLIGAGGAYSVYWGVGKVKEVAQQQMQPFVNAVVDGDYAKAAQYTSIPQAELESLRTQMQGWGRVDSVSMSGFDAKKVNGRDTLAITGSANFTTAGSKKFSVMLDDTGGGTLKIVGIEFE